MIDEISWDELDAIWYSDYGPGGDYMKEVCSSQGFDISQLNHYAGKTRVCL